MAKVGISQSNPLAALGNILRKGPGRGSGRDSKSPRRELTKKLSFKGSKESLPDGAKNSPEMSRRTSEPKSPKMFRFGIRRSSSRSKKGDRDDSASDTSSVNSLNVSSVREEPMEAESSLTVSRSAAENGEKEVQVQKRNTVEQATSCGDGTKSTNRNSTYFKPPVVEPLSGLFDSGELDALLQSKDQSDHSVSMEDEKQEVPEEEENPEDSVEPGSSGSGLKRNNLRSSFRMYENQYRAETLERKKEKSPLSSSMSSATTEQSRDQDRLATQQVTTSTPKAPVKQEHTCSDDEEITSSDVTKDVEDENMSAGSKEKQKRNRENEGRMRKLFDDELFQPLPSTKYQSRTKAATKTPSLDAYAQAHRSPAPVSTMIDRKKTDGSAERTASTESAEAKEMSPGSKGTEKGEAPDDKATPETYDSTILADRVVPDKASTPAYSEEETQCSSIQSPTVSKTPDTPLFEKTKLEKESEQRAAERKRSTKTDSESTFKTIDKDTIQESAPPVKVEQEQGGNKTEEEPSAVKVSPRKKQSEKETLNERVANRIRRRREEREEQKSRSTRSYDPRSKIEPGKVSNARSKFDSTSQGASPKMSRSRGTVESSRLTTERRAKKSENSPPALISDLPREKEQKTKEKDTANKLKATTEGGDDDMPSWRRRVLERRQKAAEAGAKPSSVISKSDRSTASPRLGRRRETEGLSASAHTPSQKDVKPDVRKSPSRRDVSPEVRESPSRKEVSSDVRKLPSRKDVSPDIRKSPSPSKPTSNLTPRARSQKHSGIDSTDSKEIDESEVGKENISGLHEGTPPEIATVEHKGSTSGLESPKREDTMTKLDSQKQEVTTPEPNSPRSDVTSPKPEITSPKPKIQIVSKRVVRHSSSNEPQEGTTCSVDVKPSATIKDEAEVFASDIEQEPSKESTPSTPQSATNLPNETYLDSQESSNSSEQEVGVPFRSRGMSTSRSPTPTSLTPGPLKLPADPGVPEWKKRVLERKKDVTSAKKVESTKKSEPDVPNWKKELLAKRGKSGDEVLMHYYMYKYMYIHVHLHTMLL